MFQGLQGHVLLGHLHPVQGRIADADFAGELFERQITALLSEKFSELFWEPVSHARNLGMKLVPHVGYLACAIIPNELEWWRITNHHSIGLYFYAFTDFVNFRGLFGNERRYRSRHLVGVDFFGGLAAVIGYWDHLDGALPGGDQCRAIILALHAQGDVFELNSLGMTAIETPSRQYTKHPAFRIVFGALRNLGKVVPA